MSDKMHIPSVETVRTLTYNYLQERLEETINAYRNEVVKAITTAYTCGRFRTEVAVNSDDPLTIKAWEHISAELADLKYEHTYNWEANRRPKYLMSMTIRWDE